VPTGTPNVVREPEEGDDLVLSIDSGLQAAGESALQSFGLPGGFVAMDVQNGEILALGSNPVFDPSVFAKPVIPPSEYKALTSEANDAPLLNRAIAGIYPTGSTFKPITALAALESGDLTTSEIINDGGSLKVGDQEFTNAGGAENAHGPVDLRDALKVSSDVFFYTLGLRLNDSIEQHEWIQDEAKELGLGEATGIDIPGELAGLVPTPEWRNDLYKEGATDRPWSVGDNINLSVGQGDLQANPLQMALVYATIANGGEVVRPHLGLRAEDPAGRVVQEIEPAPQREAQIDPDARATILDGLQAAAMEPGGTSYSVFGGFPVEIAGKTGTAETFRDGVPYDQSWYVALAPADHPRIVIALTIERGGFGADAAAPAVQQMLTEYYKLGAGDIEEVQDPTAGAATVGYD
jgi:penicillin-binding protein 2